MMIMEAKTIDYHINNIIHEKNEHKTFTSHWTIEMNLIIEMNLGLENGNWGDLGGGDVIL